MKTTSFFIYIVAIIVALFLSIGSFFGFPDDPVLGGIFWLLVLIYMLLPDGNKV